jgi:hypothetical protein
MFDQTDKLERARLLEIPRGFSSVLARLSFSPAGSPTDDAMPNSNYKTMIVVADDDEANRDLLSGMLGAEGLQVSDVFDALTTERPYRTVLQPPQALDLIRDEVRRGWWDGSHMNEFEAVILGSIPLQPARSSS